MLASINTVPVPLMPCDNAQSQPRTATQANHAVVHLLVSSEAAQVVVALRVVSTMRFSCAASASAVRRPCRVCCHLAGWLLSRLPATPSLSSSEELYQEVVQGREASRPLSTPFPVCNCANEQTLPMTAPIAIIPFS